MSDVEKLRNTIDQLNAELSNTEVDEEVKQLLQSAVTDIHEALERDEAPTIDSASSAPASNSIVGRLSEAARQYEDSHPTLSGIIGSIIDTLGRMGI